MPFFLIIYIKSNELWINFSYLGIIMNHKNSYYEDVYDLVREIPYGKVTTYGIVADALALGSARMVGWALRQCFGSEPPVPAHRVVNRKGELSGRLHFSTPTIMQELLENEGVKVVDHKIQNFEAVLWRPE